MLTQLLPGSKDFTEAIFKIPQISKHFRPCLRITVEPNLGLEVREFHIVWKSGNPEA